MKTLLTLALLTLSTLSLAQERIALVIGNADYETDPLVTTINDASEMASTLSNLGFSVTHLADANYEQMLQAIEEFGDKLHEDSVGLFYYAGHAAQIKDNNYLVPINNGHIDSSFKLRSSSVTSQSIQELMVESGSKVNFIFLDSCRNIPSWNTIKGLEEGLAKTESIESEDEAQFFDDEEGNTTRTVGVSNPQTKTVKTAKGMLISFSTNPGNTAADGSGNHSPYTKHLLEQITKPNLQVEMMLKAVQAGVEEATRDPETGKSQVPWYESSIIGSFCFNVVKDGCAKTIVMGIPFLEGVENIEQVELADGSSYVGQIIGSNTPQGKGVMTLTNGDQLEGEWSYGNISKGKITTAEGSKYEGEIQNKQMHGQGSFKLGMGYMYQGQFKDGTFNGQGVMKFPDGATYDGQFVGGQREGFGVYTHASGDVYKGQFKDGKSNGQGSMTWTDGTSYEGEWKDGRYNGKGVMTNPNGQTYDGMYINDLYNGKGMLTLFNGDMMNGIWIDNIFVSGAYTWHDGTVMSGTFVNMKLEGKGIQTYANGDRYDGEFKNGLWDGYGVFTRKEGIVHEGNFQKGKITGKGIRVWPYGRSYEGGWLNNEFHGMGVIIYRSGVRYEGEFRSGQYDGIGTLKHINGLEYHGMFKDGLQNGQGVSTAPDGRSYEGEYKNGRLNGQCIYIDSVGKKHLRVYENGKLISSEPL